MNDDDDAATEENTTSPRKSTPLPFNPIGKTHYTAAEINVLFAGGQPPTDDDRTILRAHPDRPATEEELRAYCEELWAEYPTQKAIR